MNVNYVLPCKHTSHLLDAPLCEDQSIIKKIINIAFHILTMGIPLGIYKIYTCIFPKASSQTNQGTDLQDIATSSVQFQKETLSTWSTEEKKKIIRDLPLWFIGHFPAADRKELLETVYHEWIFDLLDGRTDHEINEIFFQQIKIIGGDLAHERSKTGIALIALTIPKDDPKLASIIQIILHQAWKNALLSPHPHYAESNQGLMTYDSRSILVDELHINAENMPEQKRTFWIDNARQCRVYDKLKLGVNTFAFSIGVSTL